MSDINDVIEAVFTREDMILQFMRKHGDPVFTTKELMEMSNIKISTLQVSLSKLLREGKIGRIKGKQRQSGDFYGLPDDVDRVKEVLNKEE